ncbi:hypothetical protein G2W53_041999 [Senna tora]|uniref:Uncharacterized protein n=1 Tax=Senna tora TaxID=362788 RepID=A0A834SIC5_9FABA|nr:hypothetical protein G2W53_041999 [Senna tora]
MKLNPRVLSHLLSVPSEGIKLYSTCGEIEFESYGKSGFIWELTGKHCHVLDPNKLSPDDRILLHLVNQVVIPKLNKSNPATHLEIFYMWCISKLCLLDLPFIILRHMTLALKQKGKLPYGMVITKIAQYMGIDMSSYDFEIAKAQANYDLRLLLNMGYLKIGNDPTVSIKTPHHALPDGSILQKLLAVNENMQSQNEKTLYRLEQIHILVHKAVMNPPKPMPPIKISLDVPAPIIDDLD